MTDYPGNRSGENIWRRQHLKCLGLSMCLGGSTWPTPPSCPPPSWRWISEMNELRGIFQELTATETHIYSGHVNIAYLLSLSPGQLDKWVLPFHNDFKIYFYFWLFREQERLYKMEDKTCFLQNMDRLEEVNALTELGCSSTNSSTDKVTDKIPLESFKISMATLFSRGNLKIENISQTQTKTGG